ncbi:MAG: ABC transporter ATP-binding protein [Thermofilaceae archaeon]|nr:ABC transporter ATP-binding protein [Thermofilaceae archaeon]MCX8179945.1 ABC transporter ATP-binding protein [Thermofilaceae archaeon]MDW8004749.1 ABC transporter ATP-binding protein [Thermofilaceae archaeon]
MKDAIEASNLAKTFVTREGGLLFRGKKRVVEALKGVSFEVRRGEVFGLLGPNGAGKTTTIKILSTLLLPDAGDAWVNGYHVVKEASKVREAIGVSLYSDRGFYWKLSGRENLLYFARLYHLDEKTAKERIKYLFELLDLKADADRLVEEYSTGMKSKLNIARALLHDPPILFLDEPTIGLDPNSARKVRETVLELKKEGKTILLTTHNMFEADMLCDRVAVISKGRIVDVGTPSELKSKVAEHKVVEVTLLGFDDKVTGKLSGVQGVIGVAARVRDPVAGVAEVKVVYDGDSSIRDILTLLLNESLKVLSVKNLEPTLEDVFVTLTGERLEES